MALGNITLASDGAFGAIGSKRFVVAAGTTASIKAGEFVLKALGGVAVTAFTTNKPVIATDFLAGLAMTTSTETATAAGVVDVMPLVPGATYFCAPTAPTSWDTQAEYDALVGKRVLIDVTGGVHTILAADGATSGIVVEPLDVTKTPGMVRFSVRNSASYLA